LENEKHALSLILRVYEENDKRRIEKEEKIDELQEMQNEMNRAIKYLKKKSVDIDTPHLLIEPKFRPSRKRSRKGDEIITEVVEKFTKMEVNQNPTVTNADDDGESDMSEEETRLTKKE